MRKFIQRFLNRIPKSCTHDRFTYVTENNLCVVKCFICGSESMPWRVKPEIGKAFRESHPDQFKKVAQADENAKMYYEQFEKIK